MTCLTKDGKDKKWPRVTFAILCPAGGLSGATIIDSLDTLYLMELKEEFQEAQAWVQDSFHLNVVSRRPWGGKGQPPAPQTTGFLPGTTSLSSGEPGLQSPHLREDQA